MSTENEDDLGMWDEAMDEQAAAEAAETVELEDLQGVTGLKALRVNILYQKQSKEKQSSEKEYYTYDDLVEQIKS